MLAVATARAVVQELLVAERMVEQLDQQALLEVVAAAEEAELKGVHRSLGVSPAAVAVGQVVGRGVVQLL